jgi:hypothetical protein
VESERAVNTRRACHRDLVSIGEQVRRDMPPVAPEQRTSGPPLARLHRYLERLADSEFYGKVVVSFQHGKVHDIKVEQTKKLEEL